MPDVVVVGAGIAGLSVAAELARDCSVRVVEMEATPAHHATGRSAALYIPTYGPPTVRRLAAVSRAWFESDGGEDRHDPLMRPRLVLFASDSAHIHHLDELVAGMGSAGGRLHRLDAAETRALCPALRSEWVVAGGVDQEASDLDVAAIVDIFRARLRARGGVVETSTRVTGLRRTASGWAVTTNGIPVSCDLVVNAAGAWVDELAAMAGLAPLGFAPKRRTLALGAPAPGVEPGEAFVAHAAEHFYFGAEPGGVLFSPADETPSPPCDAKADEIDVARAIDGINEATDLRLRSVRSAWAGLRTFGPDGDLVLGPDPGEPAFVWCAGQGGYGIETAPAAARATAAMALGRPLPPELRHAGLNEAALSPNRL